MTTDLIGISFVDVVGQVVRKTEAIIEGEVYAPIVKVLRGSIYEDRDFDGECMYPIETIEGIIALRQKLGANIQTGLKEAEL